MINDMGIQVHEERRIPRHHTHDEATTIPTTILAAEKLLPPWLR